MTEPWDEALRRRIDRRPHRHRRPTDGDVRLLGLALIAVALMRVASALPAVDWWLLGLGCIAVSAVAASAMLIDRRRHPRRWR